MGVEGKRAQSHTREKFEKHSFRQQQPVWERETPKFCATEPSTHYIAN